MPTISTWLVLLACAAAAACDLRFRRIPNWLTGALAIAGVAVSALGGVHSVAVSLATMGAVLSLGTLVYSRGWFGGGDVKLAAAASGTLGYPACIPFLFYTMLGGGLLAIAFLIARGGLRSASSRVVLLALGGPQTLAASKTGGMPYALAFAFGAVLFALSQTIAPFLRIPL